MSEARNVQTIQDFFAAFGRGDLAAIDRYFEPDVEYVVIGAAVPGTARAIPWAGLHRGREAVKSFFSMLTGSIEVVSFEAQEFIAQGDAVAVFGHFRYRAISTGKLMDTDWAIRIEMRDGHIARYHFYEDTFAIAAAFRRSGAWEVENAGSHRAVPAVGGEATS